MSDQPLVPPDEVASRMATFCELVGLGCAVAAAFCVSLPLGLLSLGAALFAIGFFGLAS